jgi:hypothetical protein
MKNLTEKQQRIITEITSEFQRINKEKESQIKGSLIDISGLLKQQSDDLRLKREIEAENNLKRQKMEEIVEADMSRLNSDLIHLGLVCFYTYHNNKHHIAIDTKAGRASSNYTRDGALRLEYTLPYVNKSFESRIASIEVYSDKPVIKYSYASPEFKGIEELAKSEWFIANIKSLINRR